MATPICRCRVLYLGSAVPHITKDGLQGIQEPLRQLYPEDAGLGIDSWLSVWSNGLLLENVHENGQRVARFFPVLSLHYCAAVRHVLVPGAEGERVPRFLPLDSPFARIPIPTAQDPPLFACILRRTSGIRVLECHAFICKKEMAAKALVRCCFHAYADTTCAKQMEDKRQNSPNGNDDHAHALPNNGNLMKISDWRESQNGSPHQLDSSDVVSIYSGDENHKVWPAGLGLGLGTMGGAPPLTTTSPSPQSSPDIIKSSPDLSSSTLLRSGNESQRSTRPRQMILPAKPPPPAIITTTTTTTATTGRNNKGNNNYTNTKTRPRSKQNNHHHRPPPPPRMGPSPLLPLPPSVMGDPRYYPHAHSASPQHTIARSMEEPAFLHSSTRPLSPMASYQPAIFPYDRYYAQQPFMSSAVLPPHPHHHHHHHQPPPPPPPGALTTFRQTKPRRNHKTGSKHQQQQHQHQHQLQLHPQPQKQQQQHHHHQQQRRQTPDGIDDSGGDNNSKFSTGIYRKKGHLNERAFSYSIRQEHRSRSHGSLATLNFAAPETQRLSQMVGELSLSDEDDDEDDYEDESTMLPTTPPPKSLPGNKKAAHGKHR